MSAPLTKRPFEPVYDLQWIRGAFQTAIAIEHATMPLYSAAMYSLEVQNYPAYNTLRSVLMEEMLHMAAACNALAALGGSPRLETLDPAAILDGLPGSIAPTLRGRFAKLSKRQLDTFMRIESPDSMIAPDERDTARYPTIGSFYRTISAAIEANAASVAAAVRAPARANQVGGNLGYAVIDSTSRTDPVEQLLNSLELIIGQGEGFGGSTLSSGAQSQGELSHYARFAELRFGHSYSGGPDESDVPSREGQRRYFQGPPIEWPVVINTLAVPRDGYAAVLRLDPDRLAVSTELRAFDAAYTRMLSALDDAWNGPADQSWPSLGHAVFEMNELRVISCFNILRHRLPTAAVADLASIYPAEHQELSNLTDLTAPVFYGPRFVNTAVPART
ncbi:Uncharacterised protein [Mycolicibacterium vanbaalenii]|uniref:Iminophenyl-pyruvate dimer synthase domain-containing protein n=1 Tax=Mycolicibacterium vanbaalenii TaxID=110539 RepID=A0A5S9R544_MYCVN|nr:ferritin-like domain-containing protein [Mycolicibacterium vanbaalenii]CAA0130412.1 Uncharacterised protein [Mycolicibacterium vanbaalenii]